MIAENLLRKILKLFTDRSTVIATVYLIKVHLLSVSLNTNLSSIKNDSDLNQHVKSKK